MYCASTGELLWRHLEVFPYALVVLLLTLGESKPYYKNCGAHNEETAKIN